MTHYIQASHQEINPKTEHYLQVTNPVVVEKEWGEERIIINKNHCVKIMALKPGYQVSIHWHAHKEETFVLIEGELIIETVDSDGDIATTKLTNPLDSFTLCRNVPHTFYCPDEQVIGTTFMEASTKDEVNDSFRFSKSEKRDSSNR